MADLKDKVAIVTGGGKGIGKAIALDLAKAGAAVVVNSATEASCSATAAEINAAGGRAIAVAGDVGTAEVAEKLVAAATETYGGLHILVNNAGITRDGLLMRMKEEDWDEVLRVNLKSAFLLSKAATRPMMKARWGRIINITSVVGETGNPGQANYAAAKAGLAGMSRALARELGSRQITVNCVAPGFIETDMTQSLSEPQRAQLQQQIPLQRLGMAADVAASVLFLAGQGGAYITGQSLQVNGGMFMD